MHMLEILWAISCNQLRKVKQLVLGNYKFASTPKGNFTRTSWYGSVSTTQVCPDRAVFGVISGTNGVPVLGYVLGNGLVGLLGESCA